MSVSAPLPSGSEYSLELDLCHPINPSQCSFRVMPSKVSVCKAASMKSIYVAQSVKIDVINIDFFLLF